MFLGGLELYGGDGREHHVLQPDALCFGFDDTSLQLGQFEQVVMTAIVTLGDDAYGVSIFRKAQELVAPRSVSLGAVYVTLDRMEEKGYLSSWLSDPTPERGGRAKRRYKLFRSWRDKASSTGWNQTVYFSEDGIHWGEPLATSGPSGVRSAVSGGSFWACMSARASSGPSSRHQASAIQSG